MLYVPLTLVLVAAVWNVRSRTIPDWMSGVLILWAVAATAFAWHDVGWWSMLGGLAVGLAFGTVLFALQGLGGGDVKLLAALGALLGLPAVFGLLLCVGLAGGVLGLLAALGGRRDLAYGPAIALGFVLFLAWKEGLAHALPS